MFLCVFIYVTQDFVLGKFHSCHNQPVREAEFQDDFKIDVDFFWTSMSVDTEWIHNFVLTLLLKQNYKNIS